MTTDHVIHQALFDRIFGLKVGSIYCRQIAAKSPPTAMARGCRCGPGSVSYPELLFG